MDETNPATGVPPPSVLDRMTAFVDNEQAEIEPEQAEEVVAEPESPQPEPEQASDEVTADDFPDETPEPSAPDAFEIVHNGQQHSLTREDVIRYAQQGFDYTQKTQAVAQKDKELSARLERLAQIEQVNQVVAADLATVKAFEAQLRQYQNVDWVRLATDEPLEYPKYRAQYDQLSNGYQEAVRQYQTKQRTVQEETSRLKAQRAQEERVKLVERIPEWKDPQKYQAGATALRSWLIGQGAAEQEVDGLTDSLAVSIAYKAMKYDQLAQAKADKVKQLRTQPPVTRPGAAPAKGQAQADRQREYAQRLKKTGDIRDAAALLFTRMK
jgi:hypothetical protein